MDLLVHLKEQNRKTLLGNHSNKTQQAMMEMQVMMLKIVLKMTRWRLKKT